MNLEHRLPGTATAVAALIILAAALAQAKDITLLWDTNPEPDISGYRIYYGTVSRQYSTKVDVGNVAVCRIRNLTEPTYYFAVTAINRAGLESDFSEELFAGPLTLFYPRLTLPKGDGLPDYTGVALANFGQAGAYLRITARDRDGGQPAGTGITNPVFLSLDRGEQQPFVDTELFGNPIAARSPLGWATVDSTVPGVSGFFLMFDADLTVMDGGNTETTPLASSILSEVEPGGYTQLSIINPQADPVTVTIDLVDQARGVVSVSRTIAGKGTLKEDVSALFPGVTLQGSAYVRLRSRAPVFASQMLGKRSQYLEYLAAQDPAKGGQVLYSPQYAVGSAWRTTMSVINLDGAAGTLTLRLMDKNGAQIGVTQNVPIASNGKVWIDDQAFFGRVSPGAIVEGYVEISGGGLHLTGSVVFGDPGKSAYATALPLVSELHSSLVFSHVASDSIWYTGLAIINPNADAAVATIEVYNANATREGGAATLNIPARGRTIGLLTDYFPALASQSRTSGYIKVTVSKPVAAFASFGTNNASVLSAIPAQIP